MILKVFRIPLLARQLTFVEEDPVAYELLQSFETAVSMGLSDNMTAPCQAITGNTAAGTREAFVTKINVASPQGIHTSQKYCEM